MDPLRALPAMPAPQPRLAAARPDVEAAPPAPDRLAPFREYAKAQRLQEGDFLEGVRRILDDPAPSPPRAERAEALLRLLRAYPPTPGRSLLGSSHREVLASIDSMLAPPSTDVERQGMTITAYVSSFRESEQIEAKYRRADAPLAPYLEAVDDYIDLCQRVGKGFDKPPGDLGQVRFGGVSAFQVLYQHLYKDPEMTALFREFLPEVGRSDYALHLARVARDGTPEARQELRAAFRAVKEESQSSDQAWRCLRLAMDVCRPGESLQVLARDFHEAWTAGSRDVFARNRDYQGLVIPKVEPLVLRAAEERRPGESIVPRVRTLLEGYFLTGSFDADATLRGAFDRGFPPGSVPAEAREGLEDRFRQSVEERRRRGVKPDLAIERAIDDVRMLLSRPEAPRRIEEDGRQVRIGEITLDVSDR